jgi:hypothetical protein
VLEDVDGFEYWEAVTDLVWHDPEVGWRLILVMIEMASDEDELGDIAAGPLEDLLCDHARLVIDRVEERAAHDGRFRWCLSHVWGWSRMPKDIQDRLSKYGWSQPHQ